MENDYVNFQGGNKKDLITNIFSPKLNSGTIIDTALEFLEKESDLLDDEQYVKIEKEIPKYRHPVGTVIAYLPLNAKYFINIKKTTLCIVLFIFSFVCDNDTVKMVIDFADYLLALKAKPLHEITLEERCILIDILTKRKILTNKGFYYENKECCQNDIECPYRKNGICTRSQNEIDRLLNQVVNKKIVKYDERYKIIF